jgi:hypothetical protein
VGGLIVKALRGYGQIIVAFYETQYLIFKLKVLLRIDAIPVHKIGNTKSISI